MDSRRILMTVLTQTVAVLLSRNWVVAFSRTSDFQMAFFRKICQCFLTNNRRVADNKTRILRFDFRLIEFNSSVAGFRAKYNGFKIAGWSAMLKVKIIRVRVTARKKVRVMKD